MEARRTSEQAQNRAAPRGKGLMFIVPSSVPGVLDALLYLINNTATYFSQMNKLYLREGKGHVS